LRGAKLRHFGGHCGAWKAKETSYFGGLKTEPGEEMNHLCFVAILFEGINLKPHK